MMRLFFGILLIANAVLAYLLMQQAQTPVEKPSATPVAEIAPERLTLLSARPLVRRATEGECIEVGNFTTQTALKFESGLALLSLRELPKKRMVEAPPSNIVLLPPQQGEAGANRRAAQLRKLGFNDIAIIRDAGERRWGLSLGLFTSLDLAEVRLKALKNAGVTDARIEEHPINSSRFAYELRGLDRGMKAGLQALQNNFDGTAMRPCNAHADAAGIVKN
jgi:SPOR domain